MLTLSIIDITEESLKEKELLINQALTDFHVQAMLKGFIISDYDPASDQSDLILINYEIDPLQIRQIATTMQKREIVCYYIFYNQNPRYIKENPTQSLIRFIPAHHFADVISDTLAVFLNTFAPDTYLLYDQDHHIYPLSYRDLLRIEKHKDHCLLVCTDRIISCYDMTLTLSPLPDPLIQINKNLIIPYMAISSLDGYAVTLKDGSSFKVNAKTRGMINRFIINKKK
ncbi:MAG: hypothetical protein ACSW8B_05660 [bacterium]